MSHPSLDPTANIRLRSKRHAGGQTVYHVRLDTQCEQLLKAIKNAYDNPSNPLDVVNLPLMLKRAVRYYATYALRPESRPIEFNEIRSGTDQPTIRHRHRNPKPQAV